MRRIALLPVIIACAAFSFLRLEPERRACLYGWVSPEMDVHWVRLWNWRAEGDFDHAAKNVLSEWVRLDPQRAGKLFSFLLVLSIILGVVL